MAHRSDSPPFGAADLSNCERELIHLAGSIQPHGALVVVRESDFSVVQASENTALHLGVDPDGLRRGGLESLGGDLAGHVRELARESMLTLPSPLRCTTSAGGQVREHDAMVHRVRGAGIVLEFEPRDIRLLPPVVAANLPRVLTTIISDIGSAPTMKSLCDSVVQHFRELAGYDRVMVYKFDADGHGEVVAEARDDRFEPFLGLHYPASDIPQRARELYLRNRVRVLADVHYEPVPIAPRLSPTSGDEIDMSLCHLRSMSPLHLRYLQNMGVTATLVASLVKDGALWGLIACHHYSRKVVPYELRAACELLAEMISTRITALENYTQVNAELMVRKLERRLIDAAASTGDWRHALFNQPQTLLKTMQATGAALLYDGEVLSAGEVPDEEQVRDLSAWIASQSSEPVFQCDSLGRLAPQFAGLSGVACGVLSVTLSRTEGECLMWFRREQRRSVTWAGNPNKPFVVGNEPRDLSPRRSFAAWRELVRDTARPWTSAETALASAMRTSLVDLVLQIRSVRVLIVERQATRVREAVEQSTEPVVIANEKGEIVLLNSAFQRVVGRPTATLTRLSELASVFTEPARVAQVMEALQHRGAPWRGELLVSHGPRPGVSLALRADPVPAAMGEVLGYVLIFTDRSQRREAEATRLRLENSSPASGLVANSASTLDDYDHLVAAILGNASAAMMEITESTTEVSIGSMLRDVESAARRAADLSGQLLHHAPRAGPAT